jgi:hypothetical protein
MKTYKIGVPLGGRGAGRTVARYARKAFIVMPHQGHGKGSGSCFPGGSCPQYGHGKGAGASSWGKSHGSGAREAHYTGTRFQTE